jgi:hypothetical protein
MPPAAHGYGIASPGTALAYYVGQYLVEVVAVRGAVNFIHAANQAPK